MKKIFKVLIGLLAMLSCALCVSAADVNDIGQGTYVQFGKYQGDPIVWKCISTEDENGILLLSDKILTLKAFDAPSPDENSKHFRYGYSLWEDSTLRAWLNATVAGGEIQWPGGNPPVGLIDLPDGWKTELLNPYDQEDGFLSDSNFTPSERSLMKTVSQWQTLTNSEVNRSTNGIDCCFQCNYNPTTQIVLLMDPADINKLYKADVNHAAMYRVTDTVFLLDAWQLDVMWQAFGTVEAEATEKAWDTFQPSDYQGDRKVWILRSPYGSTCVNSVYESDEFTYNGVEEGNSGVRPAVYLNPDQTVILSGNGTQEEPYVLDGNGQYGTMVFSQGKQLYLDQLPVEENGRLLVPVRAVFESLGAEVNWDEAANQVTAVKDGTTVSLAIDSPTLTVNEESVELDAPARLVGERTLVPLRAVSEALGAQVSYVEHLNRVVIDKPTLTYEFKEMEWWQLWENRREYLEQAASHN